MIFDHRICDLGEGPFWHPTRSQLFWFDILNRKLLSQDATGLRAWDFTQIVSAAAWIDHDTLLIAGETGLSRFDIETGESTVVAEVEADNPVTRSNDGRADPLGGFWFGTMGKQAEKGAGAIYRYFRGELRQLFGNITIPNAICFPPTGDFAHFCDTVTGRVMKVALDAQGWPSAAPEVFLDLTAEDLNPDGAVVDAAGTLWVAQWGAARVAAYAPDGTFLRAVSFDASHTSCPAFAGDTLYCTTARQGMTPEQIQAQPDAGKVFCAQGIATGQTEHQVTI